MQRDDVCFLEDGFFVRPDTAGKMREWFIGDQVVRQNPQWGECLKMSNNQPADSSYSDHSHSQPAEPSPDAPIPNSLPQFPVCMRPLPEERQHLSDGEFRD